MLFRVAIVWWRGRCRPRPGTTLPRWVGGSSASRCNDLMRECRLWWHCLASDLGLDSGGCGRGVGTRRCSVCRRCCVHRDDRTDATLSMDHERVFDRSCKLPQPFEETTVARTCTIHAQRASPLPPPPPLFEQAALSRIAQQDSIESTQGHRQIQATRSFVTVSQVATPRGKRHCRMTHSMPDDVIL
jgi:hypothetical protein